MYSKKIKILVLVIVVAIFCLSFKPFCTSVINTTNDNLTSHASDAPSYSFNSKDELFFSFYSLFYYYILSVGGDADLKSQGINNLEDFLVLHKEWTGGARGMARVGNITGKYFLTHDPDGYILDQANKPGFIGFCIKNNLYVDFILFLQEFFYYFRLDEGYTDFSDENKKHGSDFLYEPAASAIDTAKFFYYDKDTLPSYFISKKHIPEMYDRIPYLNYSNLTLPK